MATVKSLAKPKERVLLSVDNSVTFSYLTKGGGKKRHLNAILRPFLRWCLEKELHLQVQWVPSQEMQADSLSRWVFDKGDYTLDRNLFLWAKRQFARWINPSVDIFASPGNFQLNKFVSRWPNHQAFMVEMSSNVL